MGYLRSSSAGTPLCALPRARGRSHQSRADGRCSRGADRSKGTLARRAGNCRVREQNRLRSESRCRAPCVGRASSRIEFGLAGTRRRLSCAAGALFPRGLRVLAPPVLIPRGRCRPPRSTTPLRRRQRSARAQPQAVNAQLERRQRHLRRRRNRVRNLSDPILKTDKPIQEKGAAEKTAPQTTAVVGAQKTGRDSAATRPGIGSATTPSPDRSERSMAIGNNWQKRVATVRHADCDCRIVPPILPR